MALRSIVMVAASSVLAFLVALPLAGQSSANDTPLFLDPNVMPDKPDLAGLRRLRFLTSLDFPPFNFSDSTKRPAGFNVELARAICAKLDIEAKCEIQALPWAELEDALVNRRGEAIIAGTAITAQARASLALTRPYFRFPARFVSPKTSPDEIAEATALIEAGLEGQSVAVESGTAHAVMLAELWPAATIVPVTDQQAGYAALKDGTASFLFGDGVSLSFFLSSAAAAKCCAFAGGFYMDEQFIGRGMAIAVRRDDDALLNALEHALSVMERDGTYDDIFARYFPISPFAPAGTDF